MVALGALASVGIPALAGFHITTRITFDGEAGKSVDQAQWNIITNVHYNNEAQEYTTSTDNLQLSGNGTLLIIPRKSASGQWTSARIEGKASYTPEDRKKTRFQSLLRFGDAPSDKQQGIWPAFWMLGSSSRGEQGGQGGGDGGAAAAAAAAPPVPWPECGELDVMERINGEPTGHGTPHCGAGDSCGALTRSVPLPDNGWHAWAVEVDRTAGDWRAQTVAWFLDDQRYSEIKGEDVGDEGAWKAIAHSPMYFILNVAVGGNWPGPPNEQTVDGLSSMMEVQYIAVYST